MTKLNVNPNRMELLKIKKRLILAKRGHKLLKDKQDELMKKFMEIIQKVEDLRKETEENLKEIYQSFSLVNSIMSKKQLKQALLFIPVRSNLKITKERIMNLEIPKFKYKLEGKIFAYGFLNTSGDLDFTLKKLFFLFPSIVQLAQLEKTIQLLALEIEKTRRRVNALEYILIPNLEETIKYVCLRLEEIERASFTQLMKIKRK